MTKAEFHDLVASAFTEYFPKIGEHSRDSFIDQLIDDLQGTDIALEDDSDGDEYVRGRDIDDEDY
jgi:hypothetical protein